MSGGTFIPPDKLKLCIKITKSLINEHPASSVFSNPVDESYIDYYKIISNPQDLGTILKRLNNNEYKSVSKWEEDINTVWSNAEKYNGKNSFVNFLAIHLAQEFKHYKKKLDIMNIEKWSEYVYGLKKEFDITIEQCPDSLQHIIPKETKNLLPDFTAREMSNFMKASEMVTGKDDIEEVLQIIAKNEPKIKLDDKQNIIEVNNLSSNTLHKIRDYYKLQLIKSGKFYPNE